MEPTEQEKMNAFIMLERCKGVVSKAYDRARVSGDPPEELQALSYLYAQLSAKPKKEEEKPAGDE
jgi:hypothetical protein